MSFLWTFGQFCWFQHWEMENAKFSHPKLSHFMEVIWCTISNWLHQHICQTTSCLQSSSKCHNRVFRFLPIVVTFTLAINCNCRYYCYFLQSMCSILIFCPYCELCCRQCKKMYLRWRNLTWQNINCVINRFMIKVMGCHQHLSLEYYGHQHYLPTLLQSNIVGELGVMGNYLLWYIFRLSTFLFSLHRLCKSSIWISYST